MIAAIALVAGCAAPGGPAEAEPEAAPEPAPVDEPDVMEAEAAGITFADVPAEVKIGNKIEASTGLRSFRLSLHWQEQTLIQ